MDVVRLWRCMYIFAAARLTGHEFRDGIHVCLKNSVGCAQLLSQRTEWRSSQSLRMAPAVIASYGGTATGKGAKLPTPEGLMSSTSIMEHRDSADQNAFTKMLRRKENFTRGLVAPTTVTQAALNSRFPSRVASPTLELRPKNFEANNNNDVNRGNDLPTQAQLFPQRRKSSLAAGANLMAGRAYELVSKKGIDGAQLRQSSPPRRRASSHRELLRGQRSFLDSSSVSQKLDWIDLQMRVPEYLENLRLGQKRRSTLVLNEDGGELPWFNKSSSVNRGSFTRPSIREGSGSRPSFTRALVSKTATEERKRHGREVEDRERRHGSVVEVPVDPEHWLLQSLRLQDYELQELFDQMENVPEMNAYDISGVRESWNELDKRRTDLAPDVSMLVKDQALLDKVKNLLTRYIEVQDAQMSKERREGLDETDDAEGAEGLRAKSPPLFEGFERNQEGTLLSVFSKGTRLCSLCGQVRTKKLTQDSVFSTTPLLDQPSPSRRAFPSFIPFEDYVIHKSIVQPVGHEKDYKSVYSPQDKRWYTVLFPALQPGKREDVQLLGEWIQHAVHNRKCHDTDDHIADIDVSFLIHSIGFLEVVRQVSLECEERGDMLLHLWRQTLRIFNQVMASVEPKVVSVSAELVHLKEVMALGKEQLADLTREHQACTLKYATVSDKLKQVNLQFSHLQRCRLCLAENLTPRAREKFVRRATIKRFGSAAGSALLLMEESAEQGTLSGKSAHTPEDERSGEGGGKVAPPESARRGSTGEAERRNQPEAASVGGIGARDQGLPATETVAASPGDIIPGSPTFRVFKNISQGLKHDDGLHSDVPVQTDDPAKQHPFWDVLDRPKTAPARLNTYGMEIFEPMLAEEAAAYKKMKRAKRLKYEELKRKGKVVENVVEGGVQENELSIQELAAETMQLLEQVGMHPKLANRFKGILAKLRLLQLGTISADGWLDELDMENTDMSFLDRLLSLDDGDGKKKGKRGQWGKAGRKGPGDSRRGSGELGLKPMKAKDLPFVPLGFAKMMKISPPPKVVKSFNERQLLKLVEGIFTSKITADAVDDEVDNERQTACEFVYDYMLNIYGLKGLAESAVHGVFKKIKKMISKGIDKCHKIRLFQRFCGFDPARGYAERDLYMYLKVLARGQSKQGVLYAEQDDGIVFLNCAQADYLFDEPTLVDHFNGDRDAAAEFINKFAGLHATTEKTTPEVQKILKATQVKRLDFDLLMENVIDFNPSKEDGAVRVKTAKKIEPLTEEEETALENLFVAGDANQDGVLTFTEFREIISSAEPLISQQNALRMFRETLVLMPDGGDSISPKAFATVAHAHGIKAPSEVIFNLLKKTWDQIQGDVNVANITEEKKEEAANLRAKLEELIASTSNTSEAVSTFRDFVLKFCVGEEGEEKPADGSKEGNESDESE